MNNQDQKTLWWLQNQATPEELLALVHRSQELEAIILQQNVTIAKLQVNPFILEWWAVQAKIRETKSLPMRKKQQESCFALNFLFSLSFLSELERLVDEELKTQRWFWTGFTYDEAMEHLTKQNEALQKSNAKLIKELKNKD